MDYWFDIDIVEYVIKVFLDFEFEFVGSLCNEAVCDCLEFYFNVIFCFFVCFDEVLVLMADCEVGIILYLVNDINCSIYLLKINEYLVVGVLVVMIVFVDLLEFDGYVVQMDLFEVFLIVFWEVIVIDSFE